MIRALAEGVKETIEAGWFFSKSKDISARAAAAFAQGRRSVVSDTRLTRTTAIELTPKDLVALTSFEAQDSTKHHGPLRTDPQGNVSCVVLPVVFTHKATAATSKKVAHCTATVHMHIVRWNGVSARVVVCTSVFTQTSRNKESRLSRQHIWRIASHAEKDDDVPILRKDLWKAAARATCLKHLACVGRAADLVKLAAPVEELSAEVHELEEGMEGMDLGEEEGELLAQINQISADIQLTMEKLQGRVRAGQVYGQHFHPGTTCSGCGQSPIKGWLYRCTTCEETICSELEACVAQHHRHHVIMLVRQPPAVAIEAPEAVAAAQQQYRVDRISARRRQAAAPGRARAAANRPFEYQVHWEGYEATWEVASDLNNPRLITAADARFGRGGMARARRARARAQLR